MNSLAGLHERNLAEEERIRKRRSFTFFKEPRVLVQMRDDSPVDGVGGLSKGGKAEWVPKSRAKPWEKLGYVKIIEREEIGEEEMCRVRLLDDVIWCHKKWKKGYMINVPAKTAKLWVKNKLAKIKDEFVGDGNRITT